VTHTPFIFAPGAQTHSQTIAWYDGGFTEAELDKIEAMCSNLPDAQAITFGAKEGPELLKKRNCRVGWIPHEWEWQWLYLRLMQHAQTVNGKYFGYDLWGFVEQLQYTVYAGDGTHYDWHQDAGTGPPSPRKLSLSLQLTEPSAYDGGDLEVYGEAPFARKRGYLAFFSSFAQHRVTPVTRGTRKSIVAWIAGPQFR
jgi:PKHD-type hydroxylase